MWWGLLQVYCCRSVDEIVVLDSGQGKGRRKLQLSSLFPCPLWSVGSEENVLELQMVLRFRFLRRLWIFKETEF